MDMMFISDSMMTQIFFFRVLKRGAIEQVFCVTKELKIAVIDKVYSDFLNRVLSAFLSFWKEKNIIMQHCW